jgi:hypothetical protein
LPRYIRNDNKKKFNYKKVSGPIKNKSFNSFGFNALRQQHEWV